MDELTIKGLDKAIENIGKAATLDVLRDPLQRGMYAIQREMAQYPRQRPGAAYRRTGTLGRRWTVRTVNRGSELVGRVGNNTTYGPFVQSHNFQARMHRGRWQTDKQVSDKNVGRIIADLESAVVDVLTDG